MLKFIALGLLGALVIAVLVVRFAPADRQVWNEAFPPFRTTGDLTLPGGFVSQKDPDDFGGEAEILERLDQIIRQTPRTKVFAGSLEAQTITYVTRSRIFGFPDYTTVSIQPVFPARMVIYARLRFGKFDMGVNKARVQSWLAQLDDTVSEDTPTR